MTPIEFIGFAAAALSCLSLIPEVHQALRTHHLKDIAWGMLLLMTLSSIFWLVYGTYNQVMPLIVSASLQLALQATLVGLKVLYDKSKKPLFIFPPKKASKTSDAVKTKDDEPEVEEETDTTEEDEPLNEENEEEEKDEESDSK